MSSTQDYLKKYMSKPASLDEHKKRKLKKKKTSASTKATIKKGNFAIHDEDEISWTNAAASDSDNDFPVVEQPQAPVYKSNSSSWATVREGEPEPTRESVLNRNVVPEWDDVDNEDERPSIAGIVVETESSARLRNPPKTQKSTKASGLKFKSTAPINIGRPTSPPQRRSPSPDRRRSPSPVRGRTRYSRSPSRSRSPIRQKRMRSASRSLSPYAAGNRNPSPRFRSRSRSPDREAGIGLQSAEQVKREMMRQKEKEQRNRMGADESSIVREAETIYRDARGRKVDRVQEKLEAAEAARKEIEKQERQMEWGKGLVQREAEEEKKKREQEEKLKPLARYKDDKDLNEELKERDRWNDPAAMFLSGTKKSKKHAPKFPLYQGNFPSNRFNIRPGYRWDGVDRSTGFEKDYIQRMNTRKNNAAEAHMWSVEDM
ncbi:Pre-mRNA-splicing factor cwc26 [Linnemannia gamsii]|uniref:Pre-mRNA-splicing factor cwc26 n=1 Tax=Linnemannia gamsii TaxID=64522 RepID=A0ABQ7KBA4_9FUNG|nr:Pre-mRNA-splicing factor cwc26 [Linnemannia gamsii]